MPALFGTKNTRFQGESYQTSKGYIVCDTFTNPAAPSATSLLNAQSLAAGGTITVFVGQPDFAQNLQLVASGATTANVTINGTDRRKNVIAETIVLNGTTIVKTLNAFLTVTSVVLPTVAATTLNIGTNGGFGLSRRLFGGDAGAYIQGSANQVFEATRATVQADASAVAKNNVAFNTAPNGSRTFRAYYVSDELYANAG